MEIKAPQTTLEWEMYYDLRYRVLREPLGQPVGSERNEGDQTGIHFAAYENGVLKAIARLDQQDATICQIRFVAVEPLAQGEGFGRIIMEAAEQKAWELGVKKILLHARENALPFYSKLGYSLIEKSHNLFGMVQHFLMEKNT
jgi:N-acetylglutamate synthase-like GNAT family acetyltransferase